MVADMIAPPAGVTEEHAAELGHFLDGLAP